MTTKKPAKSSSSARKSPSGSSGKSASEKTSNEKPVAAKHPVVKHASEKQSVGGHGAAKAAKVEKMEKADKNEKSEKLQKTQKLDKSVKSDKNEKPAKALKPAEKVEKVEKTEKAHAAPAKSESVKSEPAKSEKALKAEKAAAEEAAGPPKTKLTKDELKQFKAQLLELRAKLAHQVGAMEGEALKEGGSEVSVDHMADHGTETFDQDFTLSLIENEEKTIREIDDAIERINEGSYGMCEPCIDEMAKLCKTCPHIPKARLEAIPHTRYCVEYARLAERVREYEESQEEDEE